MCLILTCDSRQEAKYNQVAIFHLYCVCLLMQKTRRKQKGQYVQPPSSAGEAIERMLVEKKISAKINYEVLRDLDKGVASSEPLGPLLPATKPVLSTGLGSLTSFANPTPIPEASTSSSLSITRPPSMSRGRLPSLSTRKRTFSDLSGGSPGGVTSKSVISSVLIIPLLKGCLLGITI